jgi:hypothetical protein
MDRLIKFGYILPFKETYIVEDLARVFIRNIVSIYRIPIEIISNRDKLFISKFWEILIIFIDIKRKILIVFHLQIDS